MGDALTRTTARYYGSDDTLYYVAEFCLMYFVSTKENYAVDMRCNTKREELRLFDMLSR